MFQDVTTNERGTKPLTGSTLLQPWSAEADADKLMDDLFADIDRILEGGSKLPTEPAKPEYISLQSIVIPPISIPPTVIPSQDLQQEQQSVSEDTTEVKPSQTTIAHTSSTTPKRSWWSIDKLLLAAGLVSVAVTVGLLLASQKKLTGSWSLNFAAAPSGETEPLSEADAQFVRYMQRSLEAIDSKAATAQKTGTATGGSGNTSALPVPVSGNRALGSNPPGTYIDKYIVNNNYTTYPIQTPSVPPTNSSAGNSTLPGQTRLPAGTSGLSTPPGTAPTAPASDPPSAPVPPSVAIPTLSAPPLPIPAAKHTLVGLLEQGEGSAALFQIDGITQRINVGEAIGASGWTLVSVANKEAVIRRNGEVRSVYVGQTF